MKHWYRQTEHPGAACSNRIRGAEPRQEVSTLTRGLSNCKVPNPLDVFTRSIPACGEREELNHFTKVHPSFRLRHVGAAASEMSKPEIKIFEW